MQSGAKSDVVHRLAVFVQRRNDVRLVLREIVVLARAIGRLHQVAAAVLLQDLRIALQHLDLLFALRRIGEVHRHEGRPQRNRVLGEQRPKRVLLVVILEDRRERFEAVVSELTRVLQRRLEILRRSRNGAPNQHRDANLQPFGGRLSEAKFGKRRSADAGEDRFGEHATIHIHVLFLLMRAFALLRSRRDRGPALAPMRDSLSDRSAILESPHRGVKASHGRNEFTLAVKFDCRAVIALR